MNKKRAYCSGCRKYPSSLISYPMILVAVGFTDIFRPSPDGIMLDNAGKCTNRYEDGTVGVPADAREAAEEDEQPICGKCYEIIDWRA